MLPDSPILIFDGVCNVCSSTVQFVLKYDRAGVIFFAPVQSNLGRKLAEAHGVNPDDADTFLLVEGEIAFVRSDAALEIAKFLGFWRWLRVFRIVPRRWRDGAYDLLAKNRYKWFGKRNCCYVPTSEEQARFVDSEVV